MENILSKEALEIYKTLNEKYELNILDDLGHKFTQEETYLPKDFCICSLLNLYQDFKNISGEQYDILFNFAFWLEQFLGVHDGRKSEGEDYNGK